MNALFVSVLLPVMGEKRGRMRGSLSPFFPDYDDDDEHEHEHEILREGVRWRK